MAIEKLFTLISNLMAFSFKRHLCWSHKLILIYMYMYDDYGLINDKLTKAVNLNSNKCK